MTKIDVEVTKTGTVVMNGLIGNCMEMFEIRVDDAGIYHYWVRDNEVPDVIYRDAFKLAAHDRFDPLAEHEEGVGMVISVKEPD